MIDYVGNALRNARKVNGNGNDPYAAADATLGALTLSEVAPRAVDWLWPGRIACGKLTLLAGDPGLGEGARK